MSKVEDALQELLTKVEGISFVEGVQTMFRGFQELADGNFFSPRTPWLNVFELAAISKWIYLTGHGGSPRPTDWPSVLNAYKELWRATEADAQYSEDPAVIASFVLRLAYQQRPWYLTGTRMNINFKRALGIFAGDSKASRSLRSQFEDSSGVSIEDFLKVTHVLWGVFTRSPCLAANVIFEALQRDFAPRQVAGTLRVLAATRRQFRRYYEEKAASSLPSGVAYEFNPILRFPLLRKDDRYWCVFPQAINYAATRGIYFYIADLLGTEFSKTFSEAFEEHVLTMCTDRFGTQSVLTEKMERDAGWTGKTNDITVFLGSTAVLFECKNSGLFSLSKRSASPHDLLSDIRKNLANVDRRKGLFQLHDKVRAIREGRLPEPLKSMYSAVDKLFPVLLLYDEVPFANTPVTLKNLIDTELEAAGVYEFQYQIWHIDELDLLLNRVEQDEISRVVEQKFTDPSLRGLDLSSCLSKLHGVNDLDCPLFVPSGESKAWTILRGLADAGP